MKDNENNLKNNNPKSKLISEIQKILKYLIITILLMQ